MIHNHLASDPLAGAGLLGDGEIFALTERCITAWNDGDPEAILSTYSDDVVYRDPALDRPILGKADLRRYVGAFLRAWDMRFDVTENRRLAGADAQVCLWLARVRRRDGTGPTVTVPGIEIIHIREGLLCRDEGYMDLAPLLPLR